MLPSLGVLYDRVLSRHLEHWIGVHDEQTGFRKGKSTLTQLFTIRIIIETAKKSDVSTEKAFNKFSRLLLLKKQIKCGIGCTMLNALKSIYTTTSCVLHSCILSSLCYGTEIWGDKELEVVYRMGLKTVLSVRFSTCKEIIYPTACIIKKRQFQFWSSLLQNLDIHSSLHLLIQKARINNLPYITCYDNLVATYTSAECENLLKSDFLNSYKQNIRNANINDSDSKLRTYLQVNPDLTPPSDNSMFEIGRIHITRFRCGFHNLAIQTNRFTAPRVPRELRVNVVIVSKHYIMCCYSVTSF